ncbi:hypothetical protein ACHAWT_005212 [Skeletonema menzelii]
MDESPYYSGGAAGMNSRMMEDVRVGRTYTSSSQPSSPMNDEQNNAATRQIRRRVFRAALERGIHDERRKKMLDADADIGGPSVRGDGAVRSRFRHPGGINSTRSGDTGDDDIQQKMYKTNMSTRTPRAYETTPVGASESFSPSATAQQQTVSPPAPPAGPPSYRTIIEKLIKDNEPQKLPQLDKVLAKYSGREEELILKLDARYKKMKQKSDAILKDLENSEKEKGKQSLEDHGGIKQMNSWDSKKSKDVYFVKVTEAPLPGAIKLPSDIIDSNKTAPRSNVRKALAIEDEEDGDIPAIPKCNIAAVAIAAAAAAGNEVRVPELTTENPTLQEPYKFNMAPSYGDGISVITMETKETMKKKKNDRGEDTYTWLQRPPNSITVEGGSGSNIQESPLSPERKLKINKLLPDFDQEKEEDKAKADDAKLVPVALNNVEARIHARRKIMEEEAKSKAVSGVDAKKSTNTKMEKDNHAVSDADDRTSIIEDAESFVGKQKSTQPASTQEDDVQHSLLDQQELLLQAAPTQSKAVEDDPKRMEMKPVALQVGGDDDLDEEEEIDLLLKESRLQAEKAIALRKAQRELEKERKARLEAESARIALEEELARLKAGAAGAGETEENASHEENASQEDNVIGSDSEEDDTVGIAVEDQADTPFKYDLNKTFSSVSDDKSEQENVDMQDGDLDATLPLEDTDRVSSDGINIVGASPESVGSSENEAEAVDEVEPSLPGSGDIVSPPSDEPSDEVSPKEMNEEVDQSLGQGVTQRSEHDFPSTTMVHELPSQDTISEQRSDADEDANINHVATVAFEGNRAKGQLSFITGSKILAHSNQRGPWWLGRCGKQTGWFPANAVVPESEYLKNIASALPAEMDEDNDRLGGLSNEELAATYDLIRNPSDPIDDGDVDDDDDDNGSPARNRWLDDTSKKYEAPSSRSNSPPPSKSDPSKMEGLNQPLYQPNESDVVDSTPQLGFEGMNRLGKSIEEHSEDKPKKSFIGPPRAIAETDSPKILQTNSSSQSKKKKKPQEWKAAQDPSTGLTYYYHLKTRETTWEKPVDFDEEAAAGDTKAKGITGGKILRIFSKKKKPKSPTDDEIVTPSSTLSFDEKKPAAKAAANSTTENLVATRNVAGKETIIFPEHDDDDDSAASDESSLFSRENIYNQKKKLQHAMKRFTEKFTQEDSPKNSYEQLNGDEDGKMKMEASDGGIELNYPVTSGPKKAPQTQWRSAIDAATGRTYYYVKGGNETFWEKPKDM